MNGVKSRVRSALPSTWTPLVPHGSGLTRHLAHSSFVSYGVDDHIDAADVLDPSLTGALRDLL